MKGDSTDAKRICAKHKLMLIITSNKNLMFLCLWEMDWECCYVDLFSTCYVFMIYFIIIIVSLRGKYYDFASKSSKSAAICFSMGKYLFKCSCRSTKWHGDSCTRFPAPVFFSYFFFCTTYLCVKIIIFVGCPSGACV